MNNWTQFSKFWPSVLEKVKKKDSSMIIATIELCIPYCTYRRNGLVDVLSLFEAGNIGSLLHVRHRQTVKFRAAWYFVCFQCPVGEYFGQTET